MSSTKLQYRGFLRCICWGSRQESETTQDETHSTRPGGMEFKRGMIESYALNRQHRARAKEKAKITLTRFDIGHDNDYNDNTYNNLADNVTEEVTEEGSGHDLIPTAIDPGPPHPPPCLDASMLSGSLRKKHTVKLRDSWDALVTIEINPEQQDNNRNSSNDDGMQIDREEIVASRGQHHHRNNNDTDNSNRDTNHGVVHDRIREQGDDSNIICDLQSPESMLNAMMVFVAVNDRSHLLAALDLLKRGLLQYKNMLTECLGELLSVITTCLQSKDDKVVCAAIRTATACVSTYGDLLLQHIKAQKSMLIAILLDYTASCSKKPTPITTAANELLKHMASRLHQPTMIRLLEPFAAPGNALRREIRAKAASVLVIATYRL